MEAIKRWSFDNLINDFSVSKNGSQRGTRVFCRLEIGTKRDLTAVFREFTVDHEFVRTRPVVKLFEKVESVGQGFVDKIFRIWSNVNPTKKIISRNMNSAVEFMVKRGMSLK